VYGEFMKASYRVYHELSHAVSSGSTDVMECLGAKMHAWAGFISALVKTHQQVHQPSPHATGDVTHSSANSMRFSLGMHRVGAASGKTSSHHSTRRLQNLAETRAPKRRKEEKKKRREHIPT
jgi:hypothetical protein